MSNQNWSTYRAEVGWYEVTPAQVLEGTMLLKLLEDGLVYKNGKLSVNK